MPAAARQSERRPSAPIGEARRDRVAVVRHRTVTRSSSICDRFGFLLDQRERRKLLRARRKRRQQVAVLDIVAEGVEPDFARVEAHFRRPQQPRGVVDDAHDPQRRRVLAAARPDAERVERRDRAGEQRGRAVVGRRGRARRRARSRRPPPASAIAAVRPAGPPPTTTTSAVRRWSCAAHRRTHVMRPASRLAWPNRCQCIFETRVAVRDEDDEPQNVTPTDNALPPQPIFAPSRSMSSPRRRARSRSAR